MVRALDIPDMLPGDVARATLDGMERGEEEIFPDPMSQLLADGWRAGMAKKQLERQNAAMVQRASSQSELHYRLDPSGLTTPTTGRVP